MLRMFVLLLADGAGKVLAVRVGPPRPLSAVLRRLSWAKEIFIAACTKLGTSSYGRAGPYGGLCPLARLPDSGNGPGGS